MELGGGGLVRRRVCARKSDSFHRGVEYGGGEGWRDVGDCEFEDRSSRCRWWWWWWPRRIRISFVRPPSTLQHLSVRGPITTRRTRVAVDVKPQRRRVPCLLPSSLPHPSHGGCLEHLTPRPHSSPHSPDSFRGAFQYCSDLSDGLHCAPRSFLFYWPAHIL